MGLGDFEVVIRGRAIGDLFYNCGQPEYERFRTRVRRQGFLPGQFEEERYRAVLQDSREFLERLAPGASGTSTWKGRILFALSKALTADFLARVEPDGSHADRVRKPAIASFTLAIPGHLLGELFRRFGQPVYDDFTEAAGGGEIVTSREYEAGRREAILLDARRFVDGLATATPRRLARALAENFLEAGGA